MDKTSNHGIGESDSVSVVLTPVGKKENKKVYGLLLEGLYNLHVELGRLELQTTKVLPTLTPYIALHKSKNSGILGSDL